VVLFNSYEFLLFFLPATIAGFLVLAGTHHHRLAGAWLTSASLLFYGWWNPVHVPLLMGSMGFNYVVGKRLASRPSKGLLAIGIAVNVLLLGYFKYTGFLGNAFDSAFGFGWAVPNIVLPLAISFFTFQQIAYLSDAHDGAVVEHDFMNYCLFITFFPHLIAGPITHHREMLPQFTNPESYGRDLRISQSELLYFCSDCLRRLRLPIPSENMCGPYSVRRPTERP
jgi:alginate O-acetyltransferase complex protein AlgI